MSDAFDLVTITAGGRTFRCTRRTAAHLSHTVALLAAHDPSARLVVIQGCYNVGVEASAGTHDLDAVIDVQIVGMDWWGAQRFLRECGWAAWYRYPPAFSQHVHAVSLPPDGHHFPQPVGIYVPGQLDDYWRHALGLKGQHDSGIDGSWFPDDIGATVFDYPAWLAEQEALMPLNKDDLQAVSDLIDARLEVALKKAGETIRVEDPANPKKTRSLSAMLGSLYQRTKPTP